VSRILLAGASGALGGPLITRLRAAGHDVAGVTRTTAGAHRIRSLGAEPVIADVLIPDALLRAVDGRRFDAVISQLTALRKAPLRHADMRQTNRLRIDGTAVVLDAARATGAGRVVSQSIVFGYGYRDHGDRVLTEASPFGVPAGDAFDEHLAAMASTEQQTLTAPGIEGIALRYGLFYGADVDRMAAMLRRRSLPVVRGGGLIPFIHHDDAAAATVAALDRGVPGSAYNVVDDTATTFAEFVTAASAATRAPAPPTVPAWLIRAAAPYGRALFGGVSMRVANGLAARELDWRPRYASVHDGLRGSMGA
jgi:nucleoside-diphosphate-sugar epimerase